MHINRVWIASLGVFVASCSGAGGMGAQDDVGVARIALTGTPADVACIGITVVGGGRTVTRRFDATPNMSQTFMLNGLPQGTDVFTGQAYAAACASVTDATIPDWLSDGVTANVARGAVADVALVLRRNGRANVSVGFDDDDGGVICGDGVVQPGEQCDGSNLAGGSCISLGFVGGTLSCDASCRFNTTACTTGVCGNGIAEDIEQCDGADLVGETCQTLGFARGILRCRSNCTLDISGCSGVGL